MRYSNLFQIKCMPCRTNTIIPFQGKIFAEIVHTLMHQTKNERIISKVIFETIQNEWALNDTYFPADANVTATATLRADHRLRSFHLRFYADLFGEFNFIEVSFHWSANDDALMFCRWSVPARHIWSFWFNSPRSPVNVIAITLKITTQNPDDCTNIIYWFDRNEWVRNSKVYYTINRYSLQSEIVSMVHSIRADIRVVVWFSCDQVCILRHCHWSPSVCWHIDWW